MPKQSTNSALIKEPTLYANNSEPLLIAPEFRSTCERALMILEDAELFGERPEMAFSFDEYSGDKKPYTVKGSTAIIPVHGFLAHRINWHLSGWITGYEFIQGLIDLVEADDSVERVVFDLQSGGGHVAGAFETTESIKLMKKPTLGIVDSSAYSACYLLATGCDEIVTPETGGCGSIGVITMHVNMKEFYKDYGIEVELLYSGEYKADGNPFDKLEAGARERIMARLEQFYTHFVDTVAENRGLDSQAVRDTKAGLYFGSNALQAGLVDRIMTPKEAMVQFNRGLIGSTNNQEVTAMTIEANNTPVDSNTASEANTQAPAPEAQAPAADDKANETTARETERQRISGIMNCEHAEGREDLAKHLAFNTSMSVDEAQACLKASAKKEPATTASTKTPFDAAMENGNPEVGAGEDTGSDQGVDVVAGILGDYGKATGVKLQ